MAKKLSGGQIEQRMKIEEVLRRFCFGDTLQVDN